MNNLIMTDIDTVLEIYDLAQKNGKKAGDNIQAEFEEVMKKKAEKFKLLGQTEQDLDLMTGNLREQGVKIFNIHENERKGKI